MAGPLDQIHRDQTPFPAPATQIPPAALSVAAHPQAPAASGAAAAEYDPCFETTACFWEVRQRAAVQALPRLPARPRVPASPQAPLQQPFPEPASQIPGQLRAPV